MFINWVRRVIMAAMEGLRKAARHRGVVAAAVAAAVLGNAACGDDGGVTTADPPRTFAPVVELAPGERSRPLSVDWFLDRSALWFAEDRGCADRKVAVGRALTAQRNLRVNWLYPNGIGAGASYWRAAYGDRCRPDSAVEVDAAQHTRPFDPRDRPAGLRPGQGFYLDLMDWARGGPRTAGAPAAPVYAERRENAGGSDRTVVSYWMLFGLDAPEGGPAREGDWERVDVILERAGDDAYEPVGVAFHDRGRRREVAWDALEHVSAPGEGEATHPLLSSARGSHTLSPAGADGCPRCPSWPTWRAVRAAEIQPWYGFGGAWGELGSSGATSGPLGPHFDTWPGQRGKPAGV